MRIEPDTWCASNKCLAAAAVISHSSNENHFPKYLISKLTTPSFLLFRLPSLTECAKVSINCTWVSLHVTTHLKSVIALNLTEFKKSGPNFLVFSVADNLCNGRELSFINPPKWYKGYFERPLTQIPVFFLCSPKGSVWLLSSEQLEQPVYPDARLHLSDPVYMKSQYSQRDPSFLEEEINGTSFH